jgi:hypothetical protein
MYAPFNSFRSPRHIFFCSLLKPLHERRAYLVGKLIHVHHAKNSQIVSGFMCPVSAITLHLSGKYSAMMSVANLLAIVSVRNTKHRERLRGGSSFRSMHSCTDSVETLALPNIIFAVFIVRPVTLRKETVSSRDERDVLFLGLQEVVATNVVLRRRRFINAQDGPAATKKRSTKFTWPPSMLSDVSGSNLKFATSIPSGTWRCRLCTPANAWNVIWVSTSGGIHQTSILIGNVCILRNALAHSSVLIWVYPCWVELLTFTIALVVVMSEGGWSNSDSLYRLVVLDKPPNILLYVLNPPILPEYIDRLIDILIDWNMLLVRGSCYTRIYASYNSH